MSDALVNIGPATVGVVVLLLLAAWCFSHRRVDRSLAALGLYLGLLDGYLKLRTGSPFITLARDVLVAAIAAGALLRTLTAHKPLPLPPIGGLVLAFSAVVIIEVFNPNAPSLAGGLAGVRQHVEFVPLFFLGYACMRRSSQLQKLLFILIACAAAGGVVSYIQSTLSPEQFANWGPGYRERILGTGSFQGAGRIAYDDAGAASVRPFGLGSDQGAGAVAASLALPALIALLMSVRGKARAWLLPAALGISLAVATSGTRAALIVVAVSALSFGLIAAASRDAMRFVAGLAACMIVTYAVFDYLGPNSSTARRAQSIAPTKALSTFQEERASSVRLFGTYASTFPLGLGAGTVGPAADALSDRPISVQLNTETQWNYLIIEVGVVGLAIFIIINLRLMALALKRIRVIADDTLRLQLAAIAAPIFGLVVLGFAGPTSATVPAAPYFWLAAGVLSYWLVSARVPQAAGVDRDRATRRPATVESAPPRTERDLSVRSSAASRG